MSKNKRILKRLAAERGYPFLRIVDEVEGQATHHRAGAVVSAEPSSVSVPPLERSRYS
jgi:hypothetical protein